MGSWFLYQSRKTNAKLLSYAALMIIMAWLFYLGQCLDFITILLTGKNIDNTNGWVTILGYMWLAPSGVCSFYYCTKILIPEKKRFRQLFLSLIYILYLLFELFIIFDPLGSVTVIYPKKAGEDLIDDHINLSSPAFIIISITALIYVISCAFGFLYKSIQSTGVLRKKYLLLSMGILNFTIFASLEGFLSLGILLIFVRIGLFMSLWFWYFGLRVESAEPVKKPPKKEIKVEGDLFRLTKRPSLITEEEVSLYRDQAICLVCKSKIIGFSFICECKALYCEKCARALINLENACWVCNSPFDKSKPSKSFEGKEEEELKIFDKKMK
jgi:hypothetical protein